MFQLTTTIKLISYENTKLKDQSLLLCPMDKFQYRQRSEEECVKES